MVVAVANRSDGREFAMNEEMKFKFPYSEYVAEAFSVIPQALREVEGSENVSDLMIAKTALMTLRRIAPEFDSEKGTPWLAFARVVVTRDLRGVVKRGQFISDEEKALHLLDHVLDADGGAR